MKKILILLIGLFMILTLSSCANKTQSDSSNNDQKIEQAISDSDIDCEVTTGEKSLEISAYPKSDYSYIEQFIDYTKGVNNKIYTDVLAYQVQSNLIQLKLDYPNILEKGYTSFVKLYSDESLKYPIAIITDSKVDYIEYEFSK